MKNTILEQLEYEYKRMLANQESEILPDWQAIKAANNMIQVINHKENHDVD